MGLYSADSGKILADLVDKHFLIDVAKLKPFSNTTKYTRFNGSSYVRLDMIHASISITTHISHLLVTPVSFSDHRLVALHMGEPGQGK